MFIGASPHTDWLRGHVAMDEHGFLFTGRDLQGESPRPLRRRAAVLPGDEPARHLRRRRRPLGLDQTRRLGRRRRLDGRPRWSTSGSPVAERRGACAPGAATGRFILWPMKRIGFLSFGHWQPAPGSMTRTASDALLQTIELAVAAEEIGIDGAFVRVHHFARQLVVAVSRCWPRSPRAPAGSRSAPR